MNAQVRPSAPFIHIENLTLHLPPSSQLDAVILPFERTRDTAKARQRYTKIGDGLTALPDDASSHRAVFDSKFNLYRAVGVFPDALDSADTDTLIAKLNTDGYLGLTTWRRPTLEEEFGNADHTRYSPACDTNFFPDAKSSWYRTSTPYPADASYVFVVYFDYGCVSNCHRSGEAFCRPVASASQ